MSPAATAIIEKNAADLADANPVDAEHVYQQLLRNYPPKSIAWVRELRWIGPVEVPLDRVDWDDEDSWAASHDKKRVKHFQKRIRSDSADVNPVIGVYTPGDDRLKIVDGHHRALAYRKESKPVKAYAGFAPSGKPSEPWFTAHSSQYHSGSNPLNKAGFFAGHLVAEDDILKPVSELSPGEEDWQPVFGEYTRAGKLKIRLASLVKVGPHGYIHGYICVRPPCGGSYAQAEHDTKTGRVRHGGQVIGQQLKKNPEDTGYSIRHVNAAGEKTQLSGQYEKRSHAAQAVAAFHNLGILHGYAAGRGDSHAEATARLDDARQALAAGDHDAARAHLVSAETAAGYAGDQSLATHAMDARAALLEMPAPVNAPGEPDNAAWDAYFNGQGPAPQTVPKLPSAAASSPVAPYPPAEKLPAVAPPPPKAPAKPKAPAASPSLPAASVAPSGKVIPESVLDKIDELHQLKKKADAEREAGNFKTAASLSEQASAMEHGFGPTHLKGMAAQHGLSRTDMIRAHLLASNRHHRTVLAKEHKVTRGQLEAEMKKELKELASTGTIKLRATNQSLESILDDNAFKTQFETHKGATGANQTRADHEAAWFGYSEKLAPKLRPIYGYIEPGGDRPIGIGSRSWHGYNADQLSSFGTTQVILKDSVKNRSTMSAGDSIQNREASSPSPMMKPEAHSFGAYDIAGSLGKSNATPAIRGIQRAYDSAEWRQNHFFEVQVHSPDGKKRPLTPADIDRVLFNEAPPASLAAKLDAKGIPWKVHNAPEIAKHGTAEEKARALEVTRDDLTYTQKRMAAAREKLEALKKNGSLASVTRARQDLERMNRIYDTLVMHEAALVKAGVAVNKSMSLPVKPDFDQWWPVFGEYTASGKLKVKLADLVKVGPHGYIHGYICVEPPCGPKHVEAVHDVKTGKVAHDGKLIGRQLKKEDGHAGYSIAHVDENGKKTTLGAQFEKRAHAAQAVALYHNAHVLQNEAKKLGSDSAASHLEAAKQAIGAGDNEKAAFHLLKADDIAAYNGHHDLGSHAAHLAAAVKKAPKAVNAPSETASLAVTEKPASFSSHELSAAHAQPVPATPAATATVKPPASAETIPHEWEAALMAPPESVPEPASKTGPSTSSSTLSMNSVGIIGSGLSTALKTVNAEGANPGLADEISGVFHHDTFPSDAEILSRLNSAYHIAVASGSKAAPALYATHDYAASVIGAPGITGYNSAPLVLGANGKYIGQDPSIGNLPSLKDKVKAVSASISNEKAKARLQDAANSIDAGDYGEAALFAGAAASILKTSGDSANGFQAHLLGREADKLDDESKEAAKKTSLAGTAKVTVDGALAQLAKASLADTAGNAQVTLPLEVAKNRLEAAKELEPGSLSHTDKLEKALAKISQALSHINDVPGNESSLLPILTAHNMLAVHLGKPWAKLSDYEPKPKAPEVPKAPEATEEAAEAAPAVPAPPKPKKLIGAKKQAVLNAIDAAKAAANAVGYVGTASGAYKARDQVAGGNLSQALATLSSLHGSTTGEIKSKFATAHDLLAEHLGKPHLVPRTVEKADELAGPIAAAVFSARENGNEYGYLNPLDSKDLVATSLKDGKAAKVIRALRRLEYDAKFNAGYSWGSEKEKHLVVKDAAHVALASLEKAHNQDLAERSLSQRIDSIIADVKDDNLSSYYLTYLENAKKAVEEGNLPLALKRINFARDSISYSGKYSTSAFYAKDLKNLADAVKAAHTSKAVGAENVTASGKPAHLDPSKDTGQIALSRKDDTGTAKADAFMATGSTTGGGTTSGANAASFKSQVAYGLEARMKHISTQKLAKLALGNRSPERLPHDVIESVAKHGAAGARVGAIHKPGTFQAGITHPSKYFASHDPSGAKFINGEATARSTAEDLKKFGLTVQNHQAVRKIINEALDNGVKLDNQSQKFFDAVKYDTTVYHKPETDTYSNWPSGNKMTDEQVESKLSEILTHVASEYHSKAENIGKNVNPISEADEKHLRAELASALVQLWATSSNNEHVASHAVQHAAKEEFGLGDVLPWPPHGANPELADKTVKFYNENKEALHAFVRAQYDGTQEELAKAGITSVTLYRGMSWNHSTVPSWAKQPGSDAILPTGSVADMKSTDWRPISSWSHMPGEAAKFFKGGSKRLQVKASIPAKLVFSTPRTGNGCLNEREWVVLGSDGQVFIYDSGG